jgi:putative SOS response-associated peptidase YedK
MCFFIGINISRAKHIQLKDMEVEIKDFQAMMRVLQSGFDFGDWPVIKPLDGGKDIELCTMHWEFIPHFFKSMADVDAFHRGGIDLRTGKKKPPMNMLNAIGEELLEKPSFRKASLLRRCLIPVSGFYEWRHFTPPGSKKDIAYPYYVTVKGEEYFFIAGIWQAWTDQETGETIDTFALVTTAANPLMAQVHNKRQRMPLVLNEDLAWEWIQDGLSEVRIREITHYQYPSELMQAVTIQKDFRVSAEPTEEFEYADLPVIQVP